MKRILLAASALTVLALPATSPAQDKLTLALVPKAMNNPFFDLARDGCMAEAEALGDVECLYIGPSEHTEAEQIQIVQDLISRGVDGIAVAPSNAPAMARALQAAVDADIPTLTWDSDVLPEDAGTRAAFIGTNNYDIGVELANLIKGYKPDGGTLCIQSGGAAAANHNQRIQGIRDTLSGEKSDAPPGDALTGQGGWTEVDGCPLFTNDDGAVAVQGMTDILGANPDLDVFVSTGAFTQWSDNAYRQAVEPYKERLDSRDLVVVVADTLDMQMQQLKDGLSLGQVGQRPYQMGQLAMQTLRDMIQSDAKPQDPTYTGLDVCTPDNADTCLGGGE